MIGSSPLRTVVGARRARVAMGIAGVAMAFVVAALALANRSSAVTALLVSWPIMALVYGAVRSAQKHASEPHPASIADAGDGGLALFWPAAAIGLLAPLTLHFLLAAYAGFPRLWDTFLDWIRLGGGLTIPAHLVLVAFCALFARDRARTPLGKELPSVGRFVVLALVGTSIAGCVPGTMFPWSTFAIAVTGVVFAPVLFLALAAIDRHERAVLVRALASPPPGSTERAHEIALDEDYSVATRLQSLRYVVEHDERARTKALIDALVGEADDPLAPAALDVALEQFHRPPARLVRALVGRAPRAVAEMFGHYRDDEGAIETLRSLLRHASIVVRTAAIESLGRVGRVEDIATLRAVAHGGHDRDVDLAIDRIRRRTSRAIEGALSLSDAEDQAGRVSVAEDPRGDLSLPR